MEQYELPAKPLAPPQFNPPQPTPTSIKGIKSQIPYDPRQESHTYLSSPHHSVAFAQITNHVTTSLTVQSTGEENDDALIRLQENMALAIKGKSGEGDRGPGIIAIQEDPENLKRQAEQQEREKARADRRRQNQAERERDRQNRVLGRAGIRTGASMGNFDTEDGLGGGRSRPKPARKPRRRNSEYSEDEDDYRQGRTREDEYDEDDGFLVRSDEEPEVGGDDSDEEAEFGDDKDAEGEDDDEEPVRKDKDEEGAGRSKRRRVVDDEDDDDE